MEDVVGNIRSPYSAVPGSLLDSHSLIQSTMNWCRNELDKHVWTALGKLTCASSYLSGFTISDHVVWGPCVTQRLTFLTSLYIHVLRGLGQLNGTGWVTTRRRNARFGDTYLNTVMVLL